MKEFDLLKTLSSDNQLQDQRIVQERLVRKWKGTGLLEKLDAERQKGMAVMLENEVKALYSLLNESTLNSAVAGFAKIAFPLVRRVFANLIADKIVAIQPMSLPSGLLFYLDFKYETKTAKPPYTPDGSLYGSLEFNGNTKLEGLGAQLADGGFYGLNASYGYRKFRSGPSITGTTYSGASTAAATADWVATIVDENGVSRSAQRYEFDFVTNITAVDLSNLRQFVIVPTATIANDTGSLFKSFTGVTSATTFYPILNGETSLSGAQVDLSTKTLTASKIVVWSPSGSLIGTSDSPTASEMLFIAQTDLDARAEFEAIAQIPELNLEIKKVSVNSQTRKLKTEWTPEMAQDINAYHGLDAEAELTKILSEQLIIDIDREIISDLIAGAYFKDVWSRKIGKYVTLNSSNQIVANTTNSDILGFGAGTAGAGPVFRGTQKEWYQTLVEKINKMSNNIYKRILRGKANFIVTSTTIAGLLESTEDYRMEIESNRVTGTIGYIKTGTLQNKYSIYVDPYMPDALMLIGFKGSSFLESGYVYAPYVPLVALPTLFDPEDFTPRKGVLSRYGKQMIRPEYYGVILVLDLDLF